MLVAVSLERLTQHSCAQYESVHAPVTPGIPQLASKPGDAHRESALDSVVQFSIITAGVGGKGGVANTFEGLEKRPFSF